MGIELDYEEDVFEADDMVEWEGVERRRRGKKERRVCPCLKPPWPIDVTGVGSEFGDQQRNSELQGNKSEFVSCALVALTS